MLANVTMVLVTGDVPACPSSLQTFLEWIGRRVWTTERNAGSRSQREHISGTRDAPLMWKRMKHQTPPDHGAGGSAAAGRGAPL
jgi:hypothetical protein